MNYKIKPQDLSLGLRKLGSAVSFSASLSYQIGQADAHISVKLKAADGSVIQEVDILLPGSSLSEGYSDQLAVGFICKELQIELATEE